MPGLAMIHHAEYGGARSETGLKIKKVSQRLNGKPFRLCCAPCPGIPDVAEVCIF